MQYDNAPRTTSTEAQSLFNRSIEIIKANQTPSGAYIASPSFPEYAFCWFRDGAYIAYAMDLVGEHASSRRFYDWAAHAVAERVEQVVRVVTAAEQGREPGQEDLLHTRYTLEGKASDSEWPNFQLDGFGTLLWGMQRHLELGRSTLAEAGPEWREAVVLLVRYLAALWAMPCYDCWEEFGDKVHTATLAAVYGGLQSAAGMLEGQNDEAAAQASEVAGRIRRFVLAECVSEGSLCKFVGNRAVDSSLLNVSTPYRLSAPGAPAMRKTVERIEAELRLESGGAHRYADDSYYGGGEWVLLTAYLGWYHVECGETERAEELLAWIEAQADNEGMLPEQVHSHLNHPDMLPVWQDRWGPVAKPLLWSHAAYLTLFTHLAKGR